ncbi:tannase and feruloyl esterase-domain-containing protein [Coniochaeta sp. 2T2.1]|nr:tannase and feruloyl esterase-domain-containing protein [Coniochaeta sp. 2T2.1]
MRSRLVSQALITVTGFNFCNLTVEVTHPGADDHEWITIWLPPPEKWNAGFWYASGLTEGGLTLNGTIDPQLGVFVLTNTRDPSSYNLELIKNFESRAIHDLAVVAKAEYFSAQYYPNDFDGILANAPGFDPAHLAMADALPPLLMRETGVAPPMRVFDAFQAAIVAACDGLDGAEDGLIGDPSKCSFDPDTLAGTTVACDAPVENIIVTATHAALVAKILQASLVFVANTTLGSDNKTLVPAPFIASQGFVGSLVKRDPTFNLLDLTIDEFYGKVQDVVAEVSPLVTLAKPDLPALVAYDGAISFRPELASNMGEEETLHEFSRSFFVPGVGHCHPGVGPFPVDASGALIRWVEEGVEPDTLFAQTTTAEGRNVTRNLCPWPAVLRYKGGDVDEASSFDCSAA